MRALVLLAVLAPEASDPGVAIAWHPEAKASAQLRQRLRSAVADEVGVPAEAVVPDATAVARHRVARDVPRSVVERARGFGDRLDQIEAAFRGGQLEVASADLKVLRAELEGAPGLPGIAELARRQALLEARMHWARADADATDRALLRVLGLDPDARVSPRDVPPALAARVAALQQSLEASRGSWPTPTVAVEGATDEGEAAQIELVIDGVPGRRAVPPGSHYLMAYRVGQAPVAAFVDVSTPWVLPADEAAVPDTVPADRAMAERVCASLAVGWIVLAHAKDTRLGVEAYRCGSGFGPRWVGSEPALVDGVSIAMGSASGFTGERSRLADAWPSIVDPRPTGPDVPPPPKKPWYKRAWVWVLVGGVVAGGVTTGVVLGTQGQRSGVGVNADDFLRP